jgi:phosphoribosyl-dephospho-CoA transferase
MDFRPHDLLRVDGTRDALVLEEHSEIAFALLRATPFVVVRRAPERVDWVAVGIRGRERTQRFGAWINISGVLERWTPEQARDFPRRRSLPAFEALAMLEERWPHALTWGPGGSVGFELVSGVEVVTPESDLDVVLRLECPLEREVARELLEETRGLPSRLDAQIQTPEGVVLLEEYALAERPILMRTMHGVLLCDDPWATQSLVELA